MDVGGQNVRRGIDFANRLWAGGLAEHLQNKFAWWKGGKFNQTTFVFLAFIFLLNVFLSFPLFTRDVTASFQSTFFLLIGDILAAIGIKKHFFFSTITIVSLSIAPISVYLFARKMALRHELIAFLSALFFVLPSPLSSGELPLALAVLSGDGAHAVAFSILPLFILYAQAFIVTGASVWGAIGAIGMAIIAIVSPFAFFNLLIIMFVLTLSDGFLGSLRLKFMRLIFLVLIVIGLTLFWYVPSVIRQITVMAHIQFALNRFWSVAPLLIPIIPVAGSLAFLIFDRREKLRPVFIGMSLFIIYITLYMLSNSFQSTGIFTAKRYIIELSFSGAFLFSIAFVSSAELLVRSVLTRFTKTYHHFLFIVIVSASVSFLGFLTISQIQSSQILMTTGIINNQYALGIGNLRRSVNYFDITTVLASLVSIGTFVFLVYVLRSFPSDLLKRKSIAK